MAYEPYAGHSAEHATLFHEVLSEAKQPMQRLSDFRQTFVTSPSDGQPSVFKGQLEGRFFKYRRLTNVQRLTGFPAQRFSVGMTQQRFLDATIFSDEAGSNPLFSLRMDWSLQDNGRPGQAWLCFKRRDYPADANFLANTDYYDLIDTKPLRIEERCYDIDQAGRQLGGFRSVSMNEKGERVVFK